MKLFSFEFFKSKKEKDLEEENKELRRKLREQELLNKIDELEKKVTPPDRPLKFVHVVNNTVTVTLNDGTTFVKEGEMKETLAKIKGAKTQEEIIDIMSTKERAIEREEERVVEEIKKEKIVTAKKKFAIAETLPDEFEVEDDTVYFKGGERSIPPLLLEKFADIVNSQENPLDAPKDKEFLALKRFFLWCCLNPDASVADDLYDFLSRGQFKITKHGAFLGYRLVVKLTNGKTDHNLVDFISNAYTKVKTVWKKNTGLFTVYKAKNGDLVFSKSENVEFEEKIGNLKELYQKLPSMQENAYTDQYTGSMDIRIGKPVSMPREECNHNKANCAAGGLHMSNDKFEYSGNGDQGILVMAFPHNVVAIPDSGTKLRVCEYFPIMTLDDNEFKKILGEKEFDSLEIEDGYVVSQLEDLVKKTKENFVAEAKKYKLEYVAPEPQIKAIVKSLEEIKTELSGRVKEV